MLRQQPILLYFGVQSAGGRYLDTAQPDDGEPSVDDGRRVEQPMQIGADGPAVFGGAAIGIDNGRAVAFPDRQQGSATLKAGLAHVDFVTGAVDALP